MKTLFWFVLVSCCVGAVSAQERVIEKAEFDTMLTQGNSHGIKWKGEKYRMTVTTSAKVIGRPQMDHSSKSIHEFGSSSDSRSMTTSVFGSNSASTGESIRIGNWIYTRFGKDAWSRKEYAIATPAPAKESADMGFEILSSQAEYRYLGEGKLVDKPVQMFAKTERQKKVSRSSGETSETESKNIYWVDPNGMILKSEYTSETRGKFTSHISVVIEWQLDPSITLTAPEVVP